jgi:hypothetical protein
MRSLNVVHFCRSKRRFGMMFDLAHFSRLILTPPYPRVARALCTIHSLSGFHNYSLGASSVNSSVLSEGDSSSLMNLSHSVPHHLLLPNLAENSEMYTKSGKLRKSAKEQLLRDSANGGTNGTTMLGSAAAAARGGKAGKGRGKGEQFSQEGGDFADEDEGPIFMQTADEALGEFGSLSRLFTA